MCSNVYLPQLIGGLTVRERCGEHSWERESTDGWYGVGHLETKGEVDREQEKLGKKRHFPTARDVPTLESNLYNLRNKLNSI